MGAESTQEKRWMIFLSYTDQDKLFADWLYSKLRNAKLKVWYDEDEILVGDDILDMKDEGLTKSTFLIVVLSQSAVASNWVKTELKQKILPEIEKQQVTVLPLVLDDIDPEEIPTFLKVKKMLSFPRQGSDEAFNVLLDNIQRHLQRRNLSERPHMSEVIVTQTILDVPRTSTIQPTLQNPFGFLGGIDPERFVVPKSLVAAITEDIVKKLSIVIIGAPMMGKTSLLKFLKSQQCEPYYRDENGSIPKLKFALLDFLGYSDKSCDELMPDLAYVMSESLSESEHFNGSTHKEAINWIKFTVGQRKPDNPLWVLLFDEFDQVVELKGLDKSFFNELYSLAQYYNLCYVIASQRKLFDLPLSQDIKSSPFFSSFNFFRERLLTVWNEPTARTFVFHPYGKELGVFNDSDFDFITLLTAQHPMLLQKACYYLFEAYKVGKETVDYERLRERCILDAADIYHKYWDKEISRIEREWLIDYWRDLSHTVQNGQEKLENLALGQKNDEICNKLAKLGFVLIEPGPLKIPIGLQSFLEEKSTAKNIKIEKESTPEAMLGVNDMKTYKYDVFISHSSKDRPTIKNIVQDLKMAGVTYWIDHEQIKYGDYIIGKIEDGLRESKNVLVCLSSNLGRSNWSRAEYGPILNRELSKPTGKKVIPLRLDNYSEDDIPILLYDIARADYSNTEEYRALLEFLKS